MNKEYVGFHELVEAVPELDLTQEELMARSRSGGFVAYTYLSDNEDAPVWRVCDVISICSVLFGIAVRKRCMEIWKIPEPQSKKRRRVRKRQKCLRVDGRAKSDARITDRR